MNVDPTFEYLARTPLAKAISQGALAFPVLECVHVLAIALVVGTIAIVDLRLLGYRSHRRGVRQLVRALVPYTWAAFAVAGVAGSLLFISNAPKYAHDTQFQWKMALILAAAVNMGVFHLTIYRSIQEWDESSPAPLAARIAGATSLTVWIAVVFLGRWVGFTL
jgi:uncharacterized protein DUF6644